MSVLRELREMAGISQAELGQKIGVGRHQIIRYEKGETPIPLARARQLATILGCTAVELMAPEDDQHIIVTKRDTLPVLGEVAAGVWLETGEASRRRAPLEYTPSPRYPRKGQFALLVTGDSVNQEIRDGEYAICVRFADLGIDRPEDGKLDVCERHRGGIVECTIKKYRLINGHEELWPVSNDPRHQNPIVLNHSDDDTEVRITAMVVAAYRPLK